MRKIYDFSSFSSLYEAEETPQNSKSTSLYDQTLGLILTTILNSYSSELSFPVSSYDSKINGDITQVKASPIDKKVESFKSIMKKVQSASSDNKNEGASEAVAAWVEAGSKAADALQSLLDQYKDDAEELKDINDKINTKLDEYLRNLSDSSKENELKKDVIAAKESYFYSEEGNYLGEALDFLKGKKGMIEDVARQITIVSAKLANSEKTPGMGEEVRKLQSEVNKISVQMGNLLDMKNKDIKKEDIKKASSRLAEIPTLLDRMTEKMLKQDTTNKAAAAILIQALGLVQIAKEKEKEYISKKEESLKKEKEGKIKVTISSTVDYDPEETSKVNPEVQKFQELVIDKFKNINSISSLPQFKKMGSDGKFGKNTRDIVKILKAGFDLSDKSGDITKELVDEIQIQSDSIKESFTPRIFTFSDYVNISEAAFNIGKAIDTAKELPTYTTVSVSKSSVGKTPSGPLFKEGSKGPEVTAIQNAITADSEVDPGISKEEKDGKNFGPTTKKAVSTWQKSNDLNPDGIVGPKSIQKMSEIKNLGKWTSSMISKLAGKEVAEPTKEPAKTEDQTIAEELMKFLSKGQKIKLLNDVKATAHEWDEARKRYISVGGEEKGFSKGKTYSKDEIVNRGNGTLGIKDEDKRYFISASNFKTA